MGPSVSVDPRTCAVRGDLADVRLADRVFAPHYAAPLLMTIRHDCHLFEKPSKPSEALAALVAGTRFEVLDFSGQTAWGIAQPAGLVGYVDADALDIVGKAG